MTEVFCEECGISLEVEDKETAECFDELHSNCYKKRIENRALKNMLDFGYLVTGNKRR